jgi:apolipoprotein D and lipocalin family protein
MNQLFFLFGAITVASLNINQYVGTWYQVYGDRFVMSTFERGGRCITANYELVGANNISVHNSQLDANGNVQEIFGYAYISDQNKPGQLTVNLDGHGNAPYWIYELGPVVNGLYDYAIVSDPTKTSLFVLTRDVNHFYDQYENLVLQNLRALKFSGLRNKPVKTDQTNCHYTIALT